MYVSAAVLGLAGAAAAAAATAAAPVGPIYPVTKFSKGFRLVVNVTDPSGPFYKTIHGTYISSLHDGNQGFEVLGQDKNAAKGLIFYLKGPSTDHNDNKVLTDGASTEYPSGLGFDHQHDNEYQPLGRSAHLYPDGGDAYFSLLHFNEHLPFLRPDTWIACKEPYQAYKTLKDPTYIGFRQIARARNSATGKYELNIPKGCEVVKLLPECATLNPPLKGSTTHQNVVDADCYPNVKKIDWRKYASE